MVVGIAESKICLLLDPLGLPGRRSGSKGDEMGGRLGHLLFFFLFFLIPLGIYDSFMVVGEDQAPESQYPL